MMMERILCWICSLDHSFLFSLFILCRHFVSESRSLHVPYRRHSICCRCHDERGSGSLRQPLVQPQLRGRSCAVRQREGQQDHHHYQAENCSGGRGGWKISKINKFGLPSLPTLFNLMIVSTRKKLSWCANQIRKILPACSTIATASVTWLNGWGRHNCFMSSDLRSFDAFTIRTLNYYFLLNSPDDTTGCVWLHSVQKCTAQGYNHQSLKLQTGINIAPPTNAT